MSPAPVRLLRAVLPPAVYGAARGWVTRLLIWCRLMRQVRGTTAGDRFRLWLSFLAAPVTAAAGLGAWRDPVLLHDVEVDVAGIGRFLLRARTDDLWHVVPFRERAVLDGIRDWLRPGDCFVDAGASIGFYTIAGAAAVGPSGSVIAIEMLADTARILRRHIEINRVGRVRVVEAALSAKEDAVIMASMPEGSSGRASIVGAGHGVRLEVRGTTLDSVLGATPAVRLIKLDVEGAELEALQGAVAVLDRVEAIIFEHLDTRAEHDTSRFLSLHGFRTERLDGTNSLAFRPPGDRRAVEDRPCRLP